jgi:hypothetical protein
VNNRSLDVISETVARNVAVVGDVAQTASYQNLTSSAERLNSVASQQTFGAEKRKSAKQMPTFT